MINFLVFTPTALTNAWYKLADLGSICPRCTAELKIPASFHTCGSGMKKINAATTACMQVETAGASASPPIKRASRRLNSIQFVNQSPTPPGWNDAYVAKPRYAAITVQKRVCREVSAHQKLSEKRARIDFRVGELSDFRKFRPTKKLRVFQFLTCPAGLLHQRRVSQ